MCVMLVMCATCVLFLACVGCMISDMVGICDVEVIDVWLEAIDDM